MDDVMEAAKWAAAVLGRWGMPRPPWDRARWAMRMASGGREGLPVTALSTVVVRDVMESVNGLVHSDWGSVVADVLWKMSAVSRWLALEMIVCLYSRRVVCRSESLVVARSTALAITSSCLLRKELQKARPPTGEPRSRIPSVSSLLAVYFEMVDWSEAAVLVGRKGRGDVPFVDVRTFVLMGLRTAPRGVASSVKRWKKNSRSSYGTTADPSSTYANRLVMLPWPSSPFCP